MTAQAVTTKEAPVQVIDILASHDAPLILQSLFNLGEFWTKNYVTHAPQRSLLPMEVLETRWPTRDRMVFFRRGQQWPADPYIDWEPEHGGLLPRIELRNITPPSYSEWDFGTAQAVGAPDDAVALSGSYTLAPGETVRWNLETAKSNTDAFTQAVKDAVEASSKARFGAYDSPVALDLGLQITHELSNSRTETELTSISFSSGGEYKNESQRPQTVVREGFRTMRQENRIIRVRANFDYEVWYFPLQRGSAYYRWGSREEFAASMRGEEPADVGAFNNGSKPSLSLRAKDQPNPGFHFPDDPYRIATSVQYNRAIHEEFRTKVT